MPKIYVGPFAKCSCCNKATPIRLTSVAGAVTVKEVRISRDLINRVFLDVASAVHGDVSLRKIRDASNPLGVRQPYTYHRFACKECFIKTKVLYWVEVTPNNWVGGWCKFCLHSHFNEGTFGHPEEGGNLGMNLISMSASIKTAGLISAWNKEYHRIRGSLNEPILDILPPAEREEQLF